MDLINQFLGKQIEFHLSGDGRHSGLLVDVGTDIIVVFEESKFLYIPLHHLHHLTLNLKPDSNASTPQETSQNNGENISYSSILSHARGLFCEINLADRRSMHGYITDIQADYFILACPLNKIMMIPLIHMKWMSPYSSTASPYSLNREQTDPSRSIELTFAKTFEEQLKQLEGSIISLDEGLITNKIGLLEQFENNILEILTADEKKHYYHVQHIKNVCIR